MVKLLKKLWDLFDKYQTVTAVGGGILLTTLTSAWGYFSHLPLLVIFTCSFCCLIAFEVGWIYFDKFAYIIISKSSPRGKLQTFLKTKIKQGEILYASELEDILNRRNESGDMDHHQIEKFNSCYGKWLEQVYSALAFSIKGTYAQGIPLRVPDGVGPYGGGRKYLKENIEFLKKTKKEIKTFLLKDELKKEPDILETWEDLECP